MTKSLQFCSSLFPFIEQFYIKTIREHYSFTKEKIQTLIIIGYPSIWNNRRRPIIIFNIIACL